MPLTAKIFTRACLTAVWTASGLAASADSPLVVNGGFESGAKGWWGPAVSAGGVSAEQPSEGTACLKVADEYACQDKIAVQGGKRYRLSLTVRCDSAPEGSVYAQISFRDGRQRRLGRARTGRFGAAQ